jgi:hypothetical protein
MGVGVCFT